MRNESAAFPRINQRDNTLSGMYSSEMSTVAQILEAVKLLPAEQKGEFLERLREVDFEDAWDRQIEADAKAGRLDLLWQRSLTDIKAGRAKSLNEVIDSP